MKLKYLLRSAAMVFALLPDLSSSAIAAQTAVLPEAFYKPGAGCGHPKVIQFFMDAMNNDPHSREGIIDIQDVGTYSMDTRYVTMSCIGTLYFGNSTRQRAVYGIRLNSIGGHTFFYEPVSR